MEVDWGSLGDSLGPAKVVLIRDPRVGLEAIVVVDNVSAGPAIGGVRMSATVSADEVMRLARAMTLKNAMARLPHGGAKAGIVHDPEIGPADKERLVRAFARAIAGITEYIPGPDMGTNETAMAWVLDEIGRAVGLPAVLGGIPLDVIGATGFGVSVCVETTAELVGMPLRGSRVAIQGFGAVGRHAARFLASRGALIVAVANSKGVVALPDGFDVDELVRHDDAHGTVAGFPGATPLTPAELVAYDCDIWVPAAVPDVLRADNADSVRARLVVPGANIAVTAEAEEIFHQRGVVSVPDFVANAGGVICAAVEYAGGTRTQAFDRIRETIVANTTEVLTHAKELGVTPRAAAERIARTRVEEAMTYRR